MYHSIFIIIIALAINATVAHIIGNVAKDRKIGYNAAFLASFLLSPLLGILIVIASPLNTAEAPKTPKEEVQFSENGLSKDSLILIGIGIVSAICLFLLAHLDLL
jgi:hypothetical protein